MGQLEALLLGGTRLLGCALARRLAGAGHATDRLRRLWLPGVVRDAPAGEPPADLAQRPREREIAHAYREAAAGLAVRFWRERAGGTGAAAAAGGGERGW